MALEWGVAAREWAMAIVAMSVFPEAVGAQMSREDLVFKRPA